MIVYRCRVLLNATSKCIVESLWMIQKQLFSDYLSPDSKSRFLQDGLKKNTGWVLSDLEWLYLEMHVHGKIELE